MLSLPTRVYSRPLNLWVCLGIPAITVILLLVIESTNLDMYVARFAFNPAKGGWLGGNSYFLEDILHDRAKQALIGIRVICLLTLVAAFFVPRLKSWKRELAFATIAMLFTPGYVMPVKLATQVQCPWSLTEFGGTETYSKVFEHRAATVAEKGKCWPGGHAATGFSLFALFFMFRDRRPRLARAALILTFTTGTIFSISRMLQGAHFFSHNIWTAVFCWLICLGTYYAILYRSAKKVVTVAPVEAEPAVV
ncbi:MAG: phosphoesterase [Pseudomonas sp.]|nr:phosphoesterase [Pseudomonas sp.]